MNKHNKTETELYSAVCQFYLKKTETRTTIQPSNSISGYLSKENKNTNLKKYTHSNVPSSSMYNGQDMEAT